MRTVTFSHPKVAERINTRFVPVWYNRGPGFHNCEFWTERRIFTNNADSYPTRNICTFFLTPDGDVAYYIAGYFGPDVFLDILDTAERLRTAKTDAERKQAHRLASKTLTRRLNELNAARGQKKPDAGTLARLAGPTDFAYSGSKHLHNSDCLSRLMTSVRCRKEVHDSLGKDGFVPLGKVQHNYLFGNSFTEEPDREKTIPTLAKPKDPVLTTASGSRD